MSKYSTDISNMSYTNKDFGTIYPELLEIARKLSYKWDPATSDESDPGVVLLKLAAIIADKNNYNIDKNILETFPKSVTQLETARQLYEQLGYSMRHYISAETTISIALNEEPELDAEMLGVDESYLTNDAWLKSKSRSYDIPRFTMISDNSDEIVYTVTEPITISSDHKLKDFPAIQGVIQSYTVNNDPVIMSSALDYENRLYFNDTNVAENGIFIASAGTEDYYKWYAVDNLSIQPMGSYCYKFGVSPSDGRCYVEFPSDAENLIGEGIVLKYVTSLGRLGNVGKNRLKKFFSDTNAYVYLTENGSNTNASNQIQMTGDNVTILNYNSANDGRDPETLEEAYVNYEKIKTTFDTLVSLSDYTNYMTRQDFDRPFVSNGFVCDRTNDVQSSYRVVDENGEEVIMVHSSLTDVSDKLLTSEGERPSGTQKYYVLEDEMTAFDLRIYALQYSNSVTTLSGFKSSFEVLYDDNNDVFGISGYKDSIQKIKSIQHDFKSFKPGEIIILKNKYPILVKIVPQYKVDTQQMLDIVSNVRSALCNTLNAKELSFGEFPDFNTVYDAIMESDNRIKAIILDEFEYETYAVYTVDNKTSIEVRIDSGSTQPKGLEESDRTSTMSNEYWEKLKKYSPHKMWIKFRNDVYVRSILAGVTSLFPNGNEFTYSLEQESQGISTGVNKITTNLTLGLSTSRTDNADGDVHFTGKIVIQDNESVTFSMPSLTKEQQYSSYVKYLVYAPSIKGEEGIAPDSEYELTGNDFIIFFWKSSDKDQFYTYKKYTANSKAKFVCPNIYLDKKSPYPVDEPVKDTQVSWEVFRNLPEGSGTTSLMGNAVYTLIKSIAGDKGVLSGDSAIDMKCPNTVHINDPTGGYELITWYLNSSKEGQKTVLFEKNQTKYTLQNGESFIYSNRSKSHIIALGAGTVIERTGSRLDEKWECEYFDYSEFVNNPIEYLDTVAFTIPNGTNVYAHEMQFYQIGPGNTIELTWNGDKSFDGSKSWKDLYPEGDGTNVNYRVYIKDDATYCEQDISKNGYLFSYSGVTISYTDESGSDTILPNRISSTSNWEAHAVLNVNCSSTVPQSIVSTTNKDGFIVNSDVSKNSIRHQLLSLNPGTESSHEINNSTILVSNLTSVYGGSLVDVSYLDMLTGQIKPINVFAFRESEAQSDGGSSVIFEDFKTRITVEKFTTGVGEQKTTTLPVKVPQGKYILTLTQSAGNHCDVVASGLTLTTIRDYTATPGKAYYELIVPDDTTDANLKISCTQIEESDIIISIDSLYKTSTPELPKGISLIDTGDYAGLLTQINKLDKSGRYNLTYQVPSSDLIENPLDSYSFSDVGHPYNYSTICEWDVDSDDNRIDVTNKIK